mgnify:CR=1 FL=1
MQEVWQISIHLSFWILLFFLIFGVEYVIIGTTKAKETENERDSHTTRRKSVAFVVSTK